MNLLQGLSSHTPNRVQRIPEVVKLETSLTSSHQKAAEIRVSEAGFAGSPSEVPVPYQYTELPSSDHSKLTLQRRKDFLDLLVSEGYEKLSRTTFAWVVFDSSSSVQQNDNDTLSDVAPSDVISVLPLLLNINVSIETTLVIPTQSVQEQQNSSRTSQW
jgi:hypothetical protein